MYRLINHPEAMESKTEMQQKLADIPWITYRHGFKPIDSFNSDEGWGWMIRVAQMMIWNTLMKHIFLQLTSSCHAKYSITSSELMKIVLPLFLDDFEKTEAPFSIRNIIEVGKEILQKGAGEWYGAHSISQVIRFVNDKYNHQYYKSFRILTFNEGIVYKEEVEAVFSNTERDTGLLIIVPLRLGLKKIDKIYYEQIKNVLSDRLSMGILGGKQRNALYYVGFYENKIISLDPHQEQDVIKEINDDTFFTYTTCTPKVINMSSCDTTMAFWFYLKDKKDAEHLYDTIEKTKLEYQEEYLIGIQDKRKDIDFKDKEEQEFDEEFELV